LQTTNDAAIVDLEKEVVAMKAQVKSDISTFEKGSIQASNEGEPSRNPGKPITGI